MKQIFGNVAISSRFADFGAGKLKLPHNVRPASRYQDERRRT